MLLDKERYTLPRKLTYDFSEGYWNCNFDPYSEVLGDTATYIKNTDFMSVYVMPWEEVIVIYFQPDCGGYDAEVISSRFPSIEEYNKAVMID
jgi:hypothetical protein